MFISLSSIATVENIYMYISVALKTLVTQRADRLRNRLALHTGNDQLRYRMAGYITGGPLRNRPSYASVRNIYVMHECRFRRTTGPHFILLRFITCNSH